MLPYVVHPLLISPCSLDVNHPPGLSFIATDREYERQGAASLLVKWGLEHCNKEQVSAALESTMDAVLFYKKLGFVDEGKISMKLNGVGTKGESVLYEESLFVFRPSPAAN